MTLEEMAQARLEEVRAALAVYDSLKAEERRLMVFLGNSRGGSGMSQQLRASLAAAGAEGETVAELAGHAPSRSPAYVAVVNGLQQLRRRGEVRNSNGRWYIA